MMAKLRRLKACMVERGLNNKELGNIIGKTDGYISRMLNGSTIPRMLHIRSVTLWRSQDMTFQSISPLAR